MCVSERERDERVRNRDERETIQLAPLSGSPLGGVGKSLPVAIVLAPKVSERKHDRKRAEQGIHDICGHVREDREWKKQYRSTRNRPYFLSSQHKKTIKPAQKQALICI